MKKFAALDDIEIKPKGTILVISPWNFPCAIPVGGIVAGLAGGNTVILKPATVAAPVAWMFAKAFWDAGVPKEALQVIITNREAQKVPILYRSCQVLSRRRYRPCAAGPYARPVRRSGGA